MPTLSPPQIAARSVILAAPTDLHAQLRFLALPCWPTDSASQRHALAEYLRTRLADTVTVALIFPAEGDVLGVDAESLDRQLRHHVRTVRMPRDWPARVHDRGDLLGFAVRRRPRKAPPPKGPSPARSAARSTSPERAAMTPGWGARARVAFAGRGRA